MTKRSIFLPLFLGVLWLAGCHSPSTSTSIHTEAVPASTEVPGTGLADERNAILHVRGMSCPLCANNIDKQLLKVPGVEKVAVNLGNGEVHVRLAVAPRPTADELTRAIERSGFTLARIEMPLTEGQ